MNKIPLCWKKTCPFCSSNQVKLNGFYNNDRQRIYCKTCKKSFSRKNKSVKDSNEFIWFKRWVSEGYSIRQLSVLSKHSSSKLKRIIHYWLDHPFEHRADLTKLQYLIFDGTFIHGRKSIIALMDGEKNLIKTGEYGVKENSIPQLRKFFLPLCKKGLCPKSATVDGNPQVIKLFRTLWPNIVIQRCLVHIQRQGLMWCRRFPARTDARHLRKLFKKVTYIRIREQRNNFLKDVDNWEMKFGVQIDMHPENGKVFSDVKRARSMLLKALPDMFHYIDYPKIPFSSNGLEGYFSRLKSNYRQHRGLSPMRRKNYFKWYFILKNK